MALTALDELVEIAARRPPESGLTVRFLLAWLYGIGRGPRDPYDRFWRAIRTPNSTKPWDGEGRYKRAAEAKAALEEIAAAVGVSDGELRDLCSARREGRRNAAVRRPAEH